MPFEYTETFGAKIRQFFRELLGSRLAEHMEAELLRTRNDYETRLHDLQVIIASLREEKQMLMSKIAVYELTLMPHASRAGAEVVAYQKPKKPNFSFVDMPREKSRWEVVQEEHEKQLAKELEEDKKKVQEPAATAAAQG